MAGPGGGPSRRSHTKSRKGCKTCKKRHIRCDETFPQCRNCTKHQVRCDYMDNPTAQSPDSPRSPKQPNLLWTPEIEATIDLWRQTGEFPFPELRVYPQPNWRAMSKIDLRLVHHLATIANETFRFRTSKLTIWSENMPKFLSMASSHPFVMHSILSFSASHLAWISQSTETKNLAYQHGGMALKGLHEALSNFSRANSDAVLASSLLLSWQAQDWRGWASLMTGTKTVMSTMQPWRHESLFSEFLVEQAVPASQTFTNSSGTVVTQEARRDHLATLQLILSSLQRLQPYLANHEQEAKWVEQLRGYVERLRLSNPPQTADEQFQQLYALRKWLFWVPISLLSAPKRDAMVMLVLAHFYAIALAVEPMFPDIGAPFCANLALPPLEELIRVITTLQNNQTYFDPTTQAAVVMMDFPRDTALTYRNRREWARQQSEDLQVVQQSPYGIETFNLELDNPIGEYSFGASLSPAFAPSPLYPPSEAMSPPNTLSSPNALTAGPRSPYLEVPRSALGSFSGPTSNYATPLGSPAAPHTGYSQGENVLNFGMPTFGYSGGFVASPTVWT